ncbi:MAG: hypothetical protein U0Q15_08750 [Kineosporiaceae bacterium]
MPVRRRRLQGRWGELFPDLARHAVASANLLAEMLGEDAAGRAEVATRLREADAAAEQRTHAVLSELASVFVTPLDRDDVYRLAWSMRLAVRACDDAGELIALVPLGLLDEGVSEQVQLIVSAAAVVAETAPRLEHRRALSQAWVELTRLRKQAGTVHRRAMAAAMGTQDAGALHVDALTVHPAALWRLRVADHLLAASSAFEEVGSVLQQIVVKES